MPDDPNAADEQTALLALAWDLIAAVDWDKAGTDWRTAAEQWRMRYFATRPHGELV